jgi:serine/threonine-protein kinase HipA
LSIIEGNDRGPAQYLAPQAKLNVCGTRLESLGAADALMLERFDRKWNPAAQAYDRFGLVSRPTILDAEDGYQGRERWSYPLLAQELRRRSIAPEADCLELFRRMVFNTMVTNNDDHPRNHAMLHTPEGWRLSPAYDIVPVSLVSQERRDLALTVGQYGRIASVYNILSSCEEFGITEEHARYEIEAMRAVVSGWQSIYAAHGVSQGTMDMLEGAILPACFDLTEPVSSI